MRRTEWRPDRLATPLRSMPEFNDRPRQRNLIDFPSSIAGRWAMGDGRWKGASPQTPDPRPHRRAAQPPIPSSLLLVYEACLHIFVVCLGRCWHLSLSQSQSQSRLAANSSRGILASKCQTAEAQTEPLAESSGGSGSLRGESRRTSISRGGGNSRKWKTQEGNPLKKEISHTLPVLPN